MPLDRDSSSSADEFSLVDGGPLCRVLRRLGLWRPPVGRLGRRVAALILVTWLPLLLLAAVAGHLSGDVDVPFLKHGAAHARFLGALPLLLIAEVVVYRRLSRVVRQFELQGLLPDEARPQFGEILASSRRVASWVAPEAVLAGVALTLGHWLWSRHVALPVDTWYGRRDDDVLLLTPAGRWFAFVSLPLFRFFLYRWYFRIAIWYRLLWKISRLPLKLNPAHPDRAAGLGFLSQSLPAFAPLLVAHTVAMAGLVADQIWHRGAKATDYQMEYALVAIALLLLVTLPLLFFAPSLVRARRQALSQHAVFAARYVEDFARKWIQPSASPSALGNPDIQSLADLGTYYQALRETRWIPLGKTALLHTTVLLALPLLPLALTLMPLEEALARLAKLVL